MENRYKITIDMKNRVISNIKFKQGDTDSSVLEINLVDNSLAVDVTGQTIVFNFAKSDGTIVTQNITTGVSIINALTGNFQCILKNDTLAAPGLVNCEITFSDSGKILSTVTFNFNVAKSIGIGEISTNYISQIETIIVAENVRITNETLRQGNESTRVTSETGRVSAENIRVASEGGRVSSELSRVTVEGLRVTAETGRNTLEGTRISQENTRKSNETTRVGAESVRSTNENGRITAESARVTADGNRTTAEGLRAVAEVNRVNVESARVITDNNRSFIGVFDNATAYVIGNQVTYNGSTYRCILGGTGYLPTNTTHWILIAQKGADGLGSGDMLKTTYDTTNNGIVDNAEKVGGLTVLTAVPTSALFTDTIYTHPSTHSADMIVDGATNHAFTAPDDTKLAGIETSANNYTHPTGDGNLHVPATSTTNNAKVLTAGSTAGSLSWTAPAGGVSTASELPIIDAGGKFTATNVEDALSETANIVSTKSPIANPTFTGTVVAPTNTSYTTRQVRNVIISTADASGGADGDIWFKYTP